MQSCATYSADNFGSGVKDPTYILFRGRVRLRLVGERHIQFALLGSLAGDMLQIQKLPDRNNGQGYHDHNQRTPPDLFFVGRFPKQVEKTANPGITASAAAMSCLDAFG